MKAFQLLAVAVAVLVVTLPVASAAQVNIILNGAVRQTVSLTSANLVNKKVAEVHDPADITWSQVKVQARIDAARLSHTVEKIFIFKCKLLTPAACTRIAPIDFESFADTEFLWSDISQAEGAATYPQTANIMTLVKLRDGTGTESWVGFWDKITRSDYNVFTSFNSELTTIDFHAASQELVAPAKNFIENFQMIPFNWATKVDFVSSPLFAVGGNAAEFAKPTLTSASPPGSAITAISKDFFLVASQSGSSVTNFYTLNRNPSFACGDNRCDITLGETQGSCCVDCGCPGGEYCDLPDPSQAAAGACMQTSSIALSVPTPSIPTVTDCSKPVSFPLLAQISSPPSSLPQTLQAVVSLNGTTQSSTCTRQAGAGYSCPVQVQPQISCGAGSVTLSKNALNATLTFNDGLRPATLPLSATVLDITLTFACGCPTGFYCDARQLACSPQGSVALSILNVTSFIPTFNPAGDTVTVTALITNPPSDLAVTGVTYTLGTVFKGSSPIQNQTSGSVTCTQGAGQVYTCKIPLSIAGYDKTSAYFVKGNSITFTVSFSNVNQKVTLDLLSAFADITIPAHQCGDLTCDRSSGEDENNCCVDCGCLQAGMYCDVNRLSCDFLRNIDLQVLSVSPTSLSDCRVPHTVTLTAKVVNAPSDMKLNFVFYSVGGVVQPFPISCTPVNPGAGAGLYSCSLTLTAPASCQQQSAPFVFSPNSLNFTISFSDGKKGTVVQTLEEPFSDISIRPVFQCGDGVCENGKGGTANLGESAATCCIDCPCEQDPAFGKNFFCSIPPPATGGNATCFDKTKLQLVIDSPTAPVGFDSCEKSQTLQILAHLENEPSNIVGLTFSGILNGTNAQGLSCQKSADPTDPTITCTLRISSIFRCEQGKTYTYSPNSITAKAVIQAGKSKQIVAATATLPDITTTQEIRSLFDITQDAVNKFKQLIEETKQIAEELLDWVETCVDVAVTLAIAGIAAMILVPLFSSSTSGALGAGGGALLGGALGIGLGPIGALVGAAGGGLVGGLAGGAFSGGQKSTAGILDTNVDPARGEWKVVTGSDGNKYAYFAGNGGFTAVPGKPEDSPYKITEDLGGGKYRAEQKSTSTGGNWAQSMQATAAVVQTIFQIWSQMCQLITQQYQIQLQVKQMEASFLQAQLCMDVVQHQIDQGIPAGQEQSMFNQMTSCLNFGNIQGIMGQIQGSIDKTGQITTNIGNAFQKAADIAPIITGDTATLTFRCGGSASLNCCGVTRTSPYIAGGGFSWFGAPLSGQVLHYTPSNADIQVTQQIGCTGGSYWYEIDDQFIPGGVSGTTAESLFATEGQHKIQLYCGPPGNKGASRLVGQPLQINFCYGDIVSNGCRDASWGSANCNVKPGQSGQSPKALLQGALQDINLLKGYLNPSSGIATALVNQNAPLQSAVQFIDRGDLTLASSTLGGVLSSLPPQIQAADMKDPNQLTTANLLLSDVRSAIAQAQSGLGGGGTTPPSVGGFTAAISFTGTGPYTATVTITNTNPVPTKLGACDITITGGTTTSPACSLANINFVAGESRSIPVTVNAGETVTVTINGAQAAQAAAPGAGSGGTVDFFVDSITFTAGSSPNTYKASIIVRNTGTPTETLIHVYKGVDPSPWIVDKKSASVSVRTIQTAEVISPGETVRVSVDPLNTVAESDESNNDLSANAPAVV